MGLHTVLYPWLVVGVLEQSPSRLGLAQLAVLLPNSVIYSTRRGYLRSSSSRLVAIATLSALLLPNCYSSRCRPVRRADLFAVINVWHGLWYGFGICSTGAGESARLCRAGYYASGRGQGSDGAVYRPGHRFYSCWPVGYAWLDRSADCPDADVYAQLSADQAQPSSQLAAATDLAVLPDDLDSSENSQKNTE